MRTTPFIDLAKRTALPAPWWTTRAARATKCPTACPCQLWLLAKGCSCWA